MDCEPPLWEVAKASGRTLLIVGAVVLIAVLVGGLMGEAVVWLWDLYCVAP